MKQKLSSLLAFVILLVVLVACGSTSKKQYNLHTSPHEALMTVTVTGDEVTELVVELTIDFAKINTTRADVEKRLAEGNFFSVNVQGVTFTHEITDTNLKIRTVYQLSDPNIVKQLAELNTLITSDSVENGKVKWEKLKAYLEGRGATEVKQ